MKYSEIHRCLRESGCYLFRYGKRHPIWKSPLTGKTFATSYHEGLEAKKGTVKQISALSGVEL